MATIGTFQSLRAAQLDSNGIAILVGDDGGQTYVVARASEIKCSEETLNVLLNDLDLEAGWQSDMSHLWFDTGKIGDNVGGGMGGGFVTERFWVHPELQDVEERVIAVLSGLRARII